jgi:hypothetical protein
LIPDNDTYTNTAIHGNPAMMGVHDTTASFNQNAYAMNGTAMNAGGMNTMMNPYGMAAAGMQNGVYPHMGGMPQASYAPSYNPMLQYQGGMMPGGAVQGIADSVYNNMTNMYGHTGGSMDAVVGGNAMIESHPLQHASIEQIDQRIIMLRQQKYQLEMMLTGQMQPGGIYGMNQYQNAGIGQIPTNQMPNTQL